MKPSTKNSNATVTAINSNASSTSTTTSTSSRATVYENRYRFTDWDELDYYPELVPDCDEDIAGLVGPGTDLDALMRRYRRKLVRAARRRLGDEGLAEDLVQDLCVEVLSGHLVLPVDPESAVEALLEEIVERCTEQEGEDE